MTSYQKKRIESLLGWGYNHLYGVKVRVREHEKNQAVGIAWTQHRRITIPEHTRRWPRKSI